MGGPGGDGFGRGDDAGLIVMTAARWADSWSHNGEVVAKLLAQSSGFVGGGDYALASVGKRQGGQSADLIEHSAAEADHA